MMRAYLEELVGQSVGYLKRGGELPADTEVPVTIERTRDREHGDFACNIAMVLAKRVGRNPRELAKLVRDRLPESKRVEKVEIAGPGFLNFFLSRRCLLNAVREAVNRGRDYGREPENSGPGVTLEFVSANPTGPLHVGHGRGAAYGASLAAILRAAGWRVQREYYVNDHGRQMDILAVSVWLRYLELCGEKVSFPSNGYHGEYVYEIARRLRQEQGDALRHPGFEAGRDLPPDAPEGDKEAHIDARIERARDLLGADGFEACFQVALDAMLSDIQDDLNSFGVTFDRWFSERELETSGALERALQRLSEGGWLYEKGGARWFKASELGDDKDRVVVRENGRTTYFASDVAYLLNKLEREYDQAMYLFGADHHGYVPRLKAAARGVGEDPERLRFQLVQFANLYRGGEKVQMSTRSGEFVTLRELREEVGVDAARYFYIMRSHEQHLDFDLDLAKSQSNDNPVYYIQYAHARICSVFREADTDAAVRYNPAIGETALDLLVEPHEEELVRSIGRYPEVLARAAEQCAPHHLPHYLHELAGRFHAYYNATRFLVEGENLRDARLYLIDAVRQVLANGLGLIGVSAPESM